MKALRLYINALHFVAMGIILAGAFAIRQLLRLLPVMGLRPFLVMMAFITVGTITLFFLNMTTVGNTYRKAIEHHWLGFLVLLLFVGFAIGLGTMWINLVREFAPRFYLPVGIVLFMIMLLVAWRTDRNERRNAVDSKNVEAGRA